MDKTKGVIYWLERIIDRSLEPDKVLLYVEHAKKDYAAIEARLKKIKEIWSTGGPNYDRNEYCIPFESADAMDTTLANSPLPEETND